MERKRCAECGGMDRVRLDGMGGDALCWNCRHGADGVRCNAERCACSKLKGGAA